MNFTELLLNSYQYDIQEVVDNSVQKLKSQRRKQRETELKNIAAKKRERSLEKYRKARTEYQLKQDKLRDIQGKKVAPSFKERVGAGIERAGEKIKKIDVTDPQAVGRSLAKSTINLPAYALGKGISKLGRKISGSEISQKEYEKQKRDIYKQEADARLKMDRAEREALGRRRIPNPQLELEKKDIKKQRKEKEEMAKAAKKLGPEKMSAVSKIEQELRDQREKEKQLADKQKEKQRLAKEQEQAKKQIVDKQKEKQRPKPTSVQTTTQNQPQKERSFGSRLFANQASASRVASQMRRGYNPSSDITLTKPSQTNFPSKQQPTQTTTSRPTVSTQQPTSAPSLSQRKQSITNRPQQTGRPQPTTTDAYLKKSSREIVRDINPEPSAGQPPQGSRPEAFVRPQKPKPTPQPQTQQEPNNKTLKQRRRFEAPYPRRVVSGSSNLGALAKVTKKIDQSGFGDD